MRQSAQNLPSMVSMRMDGNRESQVSLQHRDRIGNDSIMSLF